MQKRNHSDYLLIEILIAVFFLMLAQTVLVQVFARSKALAVRAQAETGALAESQNIIEQITGSGAPESVLADLGFTSSHGIWTRNYENYSLMISGEAKAQEAGVLWEGQLTGYLRGNESDSLRPEDTALFTLPCVWYVPQQLTGP